MVGDSSSSSSSAWRSFWSGWRLSDLSTILIVVTVLVQIRPEKHVWKSYATLSSDATTNSQLQDDELFDSPLHDKTLNYSHAVHRHWLDDDDSSTKPPAMLLLTSYGWNQPNQTLGMRIYRGMRSKELTEAIINHPWFHPTAWEDLNEGRMAIRDDVRYYVFVDRDTCGDKNYPRYGYGRSFNRDKRAGRGECCGIDQLFADQALQSRLFRDAHVARYVLLDCGGWGLTKGYFDARKRHPGDELVFVALSSAQRGLRVGHDMGLPPPICKRCTLTAEDLDNVRTCNESARPVLVSFAGQLRSRARKDLAKLHNGRDVLVGNHDSIQKRFKTAKVSTSFLKLSILSSFSATPLGDNLFSYRFSEVMGCASIPVVYADDWHLPFNNHLFYWTNDDNDNDNGAPPAVVIPERQANRTVEILSAIPLEQRCRMRQRTLEIYKRYIATADGVLRGIVETLEQTFLDNNNNNNNKTMETNN